MNVWLTGASGLIGSSLAGALVPEGHKVTRLVRRNPRSGQVLWIPETGLDLRQELPACDAVVHLAGKSIAGRLTARHKREIRDSRVYATRKLCESLLSLPIPPSVFLCASAMGYYGNRGDELVDEDSASGKSLLADLVRDWESACDPLKERGIRVVHLRTGLVLSPKGGILKEMLWPFKLGFGGPVGDGRQYLSWIALEDEIRAIIFALQNESVSSPVNLCAPNPVTMNEFARSLGNVLNRPSWLRVPKSILQMRFGREFAEEILASVRMVPGKLNESGYRFSYSELEPALRSLLNE